MYECITFTQRRHSQSRSHHCVHAYVLAGESHRTPTTARFQQFQRLRAVAASSRCSSGQRHRRMSAARTTISMPEAVYQRAVERQKALGYSTFSDYIQALLRSDALQDRGHLREVAPTYGSPATSSPAHRSPGEIAAAKVVSAAIESARASTAAAKAQHPPTPSAKYPPHRPSKK